MTTPAPAASRPPVAAIVFAALTLLAEVLAWDAVQASGRDLGWAGQGFLPVSAAVGWRLELGLALVLVSVFAVLGWRAAKGLGDRSLLALIPAVAGLAAALVPSVFVLAVFWIALAVLLPIGLCLVAQALDRFGPAAVPVDARALDSTVRRGDLVTTAATNQLAIAAIVVVFVNALVGAILGHVALGQIARTGAAGHGLALAAVVVGWVSIGLTLLLLLVAVLIRAV